MLRVGAVIGAIESEISERLELGFDQFDHASEHASLHSDEKSRQSARPALELCGRCPLRGECLAEAMVDKSLDWGIRGSMTSAARKQARKTRSATTQGLAEAG